MMKKPLSALLGALLALAGGSAFAGPMSDITASMNQVSLGYTSVSPSGAARDFTGATAQVSYLGSGLGLQDTYLSASASETTADVQNAFNLNDYNYDLRAGKGFAATSNIALVPYVHLGHEDLTAAFDNSAANTYGVGAKALYSPVSRLVLSFDLSADHATGDVSGALATPEGLVTAEAVGADYALTQRVHVALGYGHRAFSVGGVSATDNTTTLSVGLGF